MCSASFPDCCVSAPSGAVSETPGSISWCSKSPGRLTPWAMLLSADGHVRLKSEKGEELGI